MTLVYRQGHFLSLLLESEGFSPIVLCNKKITNSFHPKLQYVVHLSI
jgi:hypothetical protein